MSEIHEEIKKKVPNMTEEEQIAFANEMGFPVYNRSCMPPELQHKVIILQDGAAAVIVNEKGEILLQSRADRDKWGLPGGCQNVAERFEDTIIREVKEETNLDVLEEDLKLITVVSGPSRRNSYPNGDVVFNNTVFYLIDKFSGNLKWDYESKEMRWFDLENLPVNQNDPDLIQIYKKLVYKKK